MKAKAKTFQTDLEIVAIIISIKAIKARLNLFRQT
jgi:hypothetical protein